MAKLSFTEHPEAVGETYVEHLGSSWSFAGTMFRAGFAALIHGIFPFLCVTTGSTIVRGLHDRMVIHRTKPTAR
jgi:hypothetical protein